MCSINHICKLFNTCTSIPVKAFDKNCTSLGELGHNEDSLELLKNAELKDKLLRHIFHSNPYIICCENNIIILLVKLTAPSKEDIYFAIGPFYVDLAIPKYNIPLKSRDCINYLTQFISLIFENILFTSTNSINYSNYVIDAIDYIHENYNDNLNVDTICCHIKISKNYLCNIFKKETGESIITFLNKYRIEKSKDFLKDRSYSMLNVAISVGFQDQSYFCRTFKKYNGISPSEYRNQFFS
ncbi:MAG: AraC family transcriptional regulator [Clostridium sp.]|uniref:AraC family transcriptional regulator n=1 Tax=Clostridium sp. TaxID=1506 RepID=UPI002A84EA02|nr:AraC family transcriptional regulator [Clostridium sp.]MDY5096994.1 AraC family transcriptional regulator [Clostridium sp.]